MNKIKKHNIIQIILWSINFITLLVIIFIDKDNALMDLLKFLFFGCLIIFPIALMVYNVLVYYKHNITIKNYSRYIPFIGICFLIILVFIHGFWNVNMIGKAFIIIMMILLVLIVIISIYKLRKDPKYILINHIKWLVICEVLYIFLVVTEVFCSYYYSVGW